MELYLALSCTDYKQLFDMNASTDVRTAQLREAEQAALDSFSPFTVSESLAQEQNTETQLAPLSVWSRTDVSRAELRLRAAAISTAGDAIGRYEAIGYSSDGGLLGGTAVASENCDTLRPSNYQLLPRVRVSGAIRLRDASNPLNGQVANATLTVTARGLPTRRSPRPEHAEIRGAHAL